ncbi:MAG: hypothetical protein IT280_01185 [Ignavibacteria bacterium]|nr:hypothetical protein [Ignavibacteria bacterium]
MAVLYKASRGYLAKALRRKEIEAMKHIHKEQKDTNAGGKQKDEKFIYRFSLTRHGFTRRRVYL